MNSKQFMLRSVIGISAVFLTISAAHAAIDNPLNPSYYADKFKITHAPQAGSGTSYVDSNNPLHPSFSRLDMGKWQAASTAGGALIIDRNNPLHPSYKRN